ncbi:hypothetical protein C8J57DRAFT_1269634 [Mycena rebaudengoi]|nr:hypothetical protein C8J57DRAFT_1269634 [Mycena rebaudengoi]
MLLVELIVTLAILVPESAGRSGIADAITMLEASNSSLLRYPTDFTRDIVPKTIHSHNDYWRDVPLLSAISLGVQSVEADVWLMGETLYVGHEQAALTPERTLSSLYIQPLLAIIEKQNPRSDFTVNQTTFNGVFDTSPATSFQLLVDMKTDGPSTLPFVLRALQPLRERGYLTTCTSGRNCTSGVITVIGTGNTPLEGIKALSSRDLFFDAPLAGLTNGTTTFDSKLSPLASTDYQVAVGWSGIGTISESQRAAIQKLVGDAHALGIKARFWDTPGWPIHARNNVWMQLANSGADWLNADDLEAAAAMF